MIESIIGLRKITTGLKYALIVEKQTVSLTGRILAGTIKRRLKIGHDFADNATAVTTWGG